MFSTDSDRILHRKTGASAVLPAEAFLFSAVRVSIFDVFRYNTIMHILLFIVSVFIGTAIAESKTVPGYWSFEAGDCHQAELIIKKVSDTEMSYELDITSECFAGSRSDSIKYGGTAKHDSGKFKALITPVCEDQKKVCTIDFIFKKTDVELKFSGCTYCGDGGEVESSVSLKPSSKVSERPSFSCSGTLTLVEKIICFGGLGMEDQNLAAAYKAALLKPKTPNLVSEQKQWNRERDLCVSSDDIHDCLSKKYRERIKALKP